MEEGVLIASDQTLEQLLPWWLAHYRRHNSHPVAIADFGLSPQVRAWCESERLIFVPPIAELSSLDKNDMPAEERQKWESLFPESFWARRKAWFKKPYAMACSPFEKTLWVDVDCEVRGSLTPLFNLLHFCIELAIVREREEVQQKEREMGFLLPEEVCYNSGVMLYAKEALFLKEWINLIEKDPTAFANDQLALSRVLFEQPIAKLELPDLYNWSMHQGPNDEAVIHHYHGALKLKIPR